MDPKPQSLDDAMRGALKDAATVRVPPPLVSSRFQIREELGRGGTSVVYAAYDRKLGRDVAVKILRDESRSDPEMAIRFRREAETVAKLAHANIITIHDISWEDGRMVLVMELAKGRSMAAELDSGKLETRRAVEILEKVSRAVGHAHDSGVVHRDLKPGNILFAADGTPKVADFGLARRLDSETRLTASGTTLGTPQYMAPEQATGNNKLLSERTDVYALGAILYHILAGRAPHEGANPADVIRRIAYDDPPAPHTVRADAPRDLELIALRAMEKDPSRRYSSAGAFADDLRRHLDGDRVQARPPSPARRAEKWIRRNLALAAAAAVFLLALAGFAVYKAWEAVQRARRISGLHAQIAAERDRNPQLAVDLGMQLKALQPTNANDELLAGLRARARRRASADRTAEGKVAAARNAEIEETLKDLRRRRLKLEQAIEMRPEADRKELRDTERRIEALERERREALSRTINHYLTAVQLDATNDEPLRFLSDYYWEAFERAEWAGDEFGEADARAHLRLLDPEREKKCNPEHVRGSARIASIPPGATVELFRYEEGVDRLLVPGPVAESAGDLPGGSYLAILSLEGRRPTRFPFAVTRRHPHVAAAVRVLREDEIGDRFVFVPGGRSVVGSDDARKVIDTRDLIVGKFEITRGEYAEFLTALSAAGPELLRALDVKKPQDFDPRDFKPRSDPWNSWRPGDAVEGAGLPVTEVTHKNARMYCVWRGQRDGLPWRLPKSAEREPLVRGADARPYPWGSSFDWLWLNGGRRQEKPRPLPVGSIAEDQSPYGIFDLAGNVKEWCDDWQEEKARLRAIRGGGYGDREPAEFAAWFEDGDPADERDEESGFRIVRTYEPKD